MDARWTQLQTELRDLAFVLDRHGSHVAADLASAIAARIDELHADEYEQLPPSAGLVSVAVMSPASSIF